MSRIGHWFSILSRPNGIGFALIAATSTIFWTVIFLILRTYFLT